MTGLLTQEPQTAQKTYTTQSITGTLPARNWLTSSFQFLRFGTVGGLNTLIDLLAFNGLLLLWPTKNTLLLLAYNTLAYTLGGLNSFLLNKYWTFRHQRYITSQEVWRFIAMTLLGLACSDALVWLINTLLHSLIHNTTLLANVAKLVALMATTLISYFGMRLWVFARPRPATDQH